MKLIKAFLKFVWVFVIGFSILVVGVIIAGLGFPFMFIWIAAVIVVGSIALLGLFVHSLFAWIFKKD